jgi:two-component system cell cycle sensor histidine kinase/response regulator CckA
MLDPTVPRMDGEETLRALRKLQPDLRVLIMSGFSAQNMATRFEKMALVDFCPKYISLSNTRA